MKIELNIRYNTRNGSIYGSININSKEQVCKFNELLTADKWCKFTQTKKIISDEELISYVSDPTFDHDALYAWTQGDHLVKWNKNHKVAYVLYDNVSYTLPLNTLPMRDYVNKPDMYFRNY